MTARVSEVLSSPHGHMCLQTDVGEPGVDLDVREAFSLDAWSVLRPSAESDNEVAN